MSSERSKRNICLARKLRFACWYLSCFPIFHDFPRWIITTCPWIDSQSTRHVLLGSAFRTPWLGLSGFGATFRRRCQEENHCGRVGAPTERQPWRLVVAVGCCLLFVGCWLLAVGVFFAWLVQPVQQAVQWCHLNGLPLVQNVQCPPQKMIFASRGY